MSDQSIQKALIYVMVTVSASDRVMSDDELAKIGNITRSLPVFYGYNPDQLIDDAKACGDILQADNGLDQIMTLVVDTVPARLRETVYALAVEVAAADLDLKQEELRLLQMLRDRLDIDKLSVAAIERGARARHQTL